MKCPYCETVMEYHPDGYHRCPFCNGEFLPGFEEEEKGIHVNDIRKVYFSQLKRPPGAKGGGNKPRKKKKKPVRFVRSYWEIKD